MLIRNFCDSGGCVYLGSRASGKTTRVRPHNAFVHKDLYTKLPYDGSEPDTGYESRLSEIESDTAPILDDIILAIRKRAVPELTPDQELMVQRFHFLTARRTPESQKRVAAVDGDEAFWQAVRRLPEYDTQMGIHEQGRLMAIEGMRGLADKILHNVNADFAAADDERLAAEEAKFWADVEAALGIKVFFCEPRSPWQRPTNEHTNGLLRRWLPKGTSLDIAQLRLAVIEDKLNHMPRRLHHWASAHDIYTQLTCNHR